MASGSRARAMLVARLPSANRAPLPPSNTFGIRSGAGCARTRTLPPTSIPCTTRSGLRKASVPTASGQKPLSLHVKDLIERGLIKAPARLFGFHSGKRIQALLGADGIFSYRGQRY